MNLLDALSEDAQRADNVRGLIGKVTGVAGRAVDVNVRGATVPSVPVADSYPSPGIGDVVLVIKLGSAWLALTTVGKISTGGANLLTNPGFEYEDTANATTLGSLRSWSARSSTFAPASVVRSAGGHSGDFSARMPLVALATGSLQSDLVQIVPLAQYRVGFWLRTGYPFPTGSSVRARVYWRSSATDPAFSQSDSTIVQPTTAGVWTYAETLVTAPTGSAFAQVELRYDTGSTGPSSDFIYFDDATFRAA